MGLLPQLTLLSRQADRLQVEAVSLAEEVSALCQKVENIETKVSFLIDEGFPPLPSQEFSALQALQRVHGLEDGFPELPEEWLRIAARAFPCSP